MKPPTYLGDGVYARFNEYGHLVLTTGSHEPEIYDDVIYFEPEVLAALVNYIKS